MTCVSPAVADVLIQLDAEAREWLEEKDDNNKPKRPLPANIVLYDNGGFSWNQPPSPHYRVARQVIIADPDVRDPEQLYVLRVVMAWRRVQHARKANKADDEKRWRKWVNVLLAMPLAQIPKRNKAGAPPRYDWPGVTTMLRQRFAKEGQPVHKERAYEMMRDWFGNRGNGDVPDPKLLQRHLDAIWEE